MSCTPSVNASETEKDEGTLAHVAKNIYSFVYDKGSNVQYNKHDLINWDVMRQSNEGEGDDDWLNCLSYRERRR
jgi:beta-galactosidase GanA